MLKDQILNDQKAAMKGGDKPRLATIRLIMAAIKQQEVDSRKELSDEDVITILTKMVKQRRDSVEQYTKAGRNDLADPISESCSGRPEPDLHDTDSRGHRETLS